MRAPGTRRALGEALLLLGVAVTAAGLLGPLEAPRTASADEKKAPADGEKKAPAKEAPGARPFAAGEGPTLRSVKARWQDGDLESASALTDPDPEKPALMPPGPVCLRFTPLSAAAAKERGLGDGEKAPAVQRYLLILTKDAVVWWASELDDLFTGKAERFVYGAVIVPRGDEPSFTLVDGAARLGWRAAYVFADVGGRRIALPRESVTLSSGAAPAAAPGEVRVTVGAQ